MHLSEDFLEVVEAGHSGFPRLCVGARRPRRAASGGSGGMGAKGAFGGRLIRVGHRMMIMVPNGVRSPDDVARALNGS